ncbi:MAG: hypothetical protein OHK0023_25510 [Anaerolineae bacterium]
MQVFISYARADNAFARRLADDLAEYDLQLWLDVRNIPKGANWDIEVQKGLDASDLMLVLLSPESVASQNVADEWSYFIDKDKPVLPLLIAPCEVPFRLMRRQRIDFTADYELGMRELIRAMGSPPKLDPDSTAKITLPASIIPKPQSASRGAPQAGSPPAFRSSPRTPNQTPAAPEIGVRRMPVVWGEQYSLLRGLVGGGAGEAILNSSEMVLVPRDQPVILIPLQSLITVKLRNGIDPHLKITYYGHHGRFETLYLMGATRLRRVAINQEIINVLKLLTGRSLE